jgi:prepilin-type N-terminal cleavage/methylation domain-containing protein
MNAHFQTPGRTGFTLIEVLVSLGLCALLATATASAIAFAARAERGAARDGEASLLLQSLYAAQRLRPDDLPVAPRGWRVERASEILTLPDESRREWHVLSVAADGHEIPPFVIRILDDAP